jgi:hypothetical protein
MADQSPLFLFGQLPLPWWEHEATDDSNPQLARAVIDTCQDIEKRQFSIFEGNRRHAKIYAGYLPQGLAWGSSPTANARVPFEATKGLIRSVCDTATALIVRTRPRAAIVTDGADWNVAQEADQMEQFCTGAYELSNIYKVAPRSFHDSTIFGTGGWKYVERGQGDQYRIETERVLPDDLVVDEDECREHLEPQNVYHRVIVRTEAILRRYASGDSARDTELRLKLLAAGGQGTWPTRYVPKDYMVVVMAYHVDPDDPSKNRRVLAAGNVVLSDEQWPFPWHPFTFLWWALPITGFYGDGIAYRQFGRQQRITYLYRWIHRCQELFATPTAWVDPAGGPPVQHMSNEIGRVVMTRRPPVFQVPNAVPPEIYRWLDELERGGYEDEGISQVTADNRLPPGIESAPAQREYSYKEGQRFAPVSQRWEDAVGIDPAYKLIAMYRRHMMKTESKLTVKWADRRFVHQVDWPNIPDDKFVVRAEAASLDSLSPAARIQSALELAQTGWVSPQEGRELVDHPDLRESDEMDNAPRAYARKVLQRLYKGESVQVDEYADLGTLEDIVRKGRLLAIDKNAPDRIVDGLSRFLDDLDAQKQKVAQAQAAQMAMQGSAGAPAPGMSTAASQGMPVPFGGGQG